MPRYVPLPALAAGPWCWPPEETIAAELLVARLGPPRDPPAGELAAVTVRDEVASLWWLAPQGTAGPPAAALGPEALASWEAAGLALPRSVPLLWRDVHRAARVAPRVGLLDVTRHSSGFMPRDAVVDGPSFGLAFFLQLASVVLDCPVPTHLVASASIDAYGRLGAVGSIADKVAGLRALAPRVRLLLVAADQAEAARRAGGTRLEVVGIRHAAEALEHAFGSLLSRRLVDGGADGTTRAELADAFFRLALVGRGAAVDWTPIERGATLALDTWPDLDADLRYQLLFARAVAARHESNRGALPLPDAAWLRLQPRVRRLQVLAHLIQQCADTGTPDAVRTQDVARPWLTLDTHEATIPEMVLLGAHARLWAVTGQAGRALATQRDLTLAYLRIYAEEHASFPLAEWIRLAGALGDTAALREAHDVHDRLVVSGGHGAHGRPYVELALARARLTRDEGDREAQREMVRLASDDTLPSHVRWSAHRWVPEGRDLLESAAERDVHAARALALVRLDRCLTAGDTEGADLCADALQQLDPGCVGHLRSSGASPAEVARLYPY